MSRFLSTTNGCHQHYQRYLEELINRRDNHTAVRYFESIATTCRKKADIESGITIRFGAKAYLLTGQTHRSLELIRISIKILSGVVGEKEELAESYMVLGDTLREIGEYGEAERAFQDSESIFRRDDNLIRAGDALNRLAGIYFRKGNFGQSLHCLMNAIEFAKKEDKKEKLGYLFGNIGRIYTLMGRLNKAEENIRFDIELSGEFNNEKELAGAYLSLGYIQIQQYRFNDAEKSFEKSLEYIKRNNFIKKEIICLTYQGELALKSKRYDEALKLLGEAAERGKNIAPNSLLAFRPVRWLAELMTAQNNFRKGLKFANQALTVMKKLDNEVEIGALKKVVAICLEQLERNDKAREAFFESIDILEKHKAKLELADTLTAAGHSSLFGTVRKTMYLYRAEELYHHCGIPSKELELQRKIGSLNVNTCHQDTNRTETDDITITPTRNTEMKKIISQLKLFRNSDLPILLTGETGTGKDYLARYFHSIARPNSPYIAVNCAAIPDNLIESELFGHNKGAFTGAESDRHGLFQAANHGVLLLDEIAELPLTLQAKLLSILETRKLRPLGTAKEIELDIIIMAATNRNLQEMVEAGIFRQDLFYRLAGITLELPPLRKRREDIPCLVKHFMRKFDMLSEGEKPDGELISQFVAFDWPGNIRQLENMVKQIWVISSMSREESISELARGFFRKKSDEETGSLFEQVESFEKRLLQEALVSSDGNKSRAARMLSIHESTFRAKLKRYSLEGTVN